MKHLHLLALVCLWHLSNCENLETNVPKNVKIDNDNDEVALDGNSESSIGSPLKEIVSSIIQANPESLKRIRKSPQFGQVSKKWK